MMSGRWGSWLIGFRGRSVERGALGKGFLVVAVGSRQPLILCLRMDDNVDFPSKT